MFANTFGRLGGFGRCVYIWFLLASSATASQIDIKGFNALSDDQKRDVVLAALYSRDAAIQNFSYKVREEFVISSTANSEKLIKHSVYEVKRLGAKNLLHCQRLDGEPGGMGEF